MNEVTELYDLMYNHFGAQAWWPAETPFEVMVGAILTQNTHWGNVEKAINNLRSAGVLDYRSLANMSAAEIAELIRPSGYYNLKAQRLCNLLLMVSEKYGGDLEHFLQDDMEAARENLLSVKGIGLETADSILLYACGKPTFVVDAYTHRVLSRHNLIEEETDYTTIQTYLSDRLVAEIELFNEFHALFVRTAVTYCKKNKPLCENCPLNGFNL